VGKKEKRRHEGAGENLCERKIIEESFKDGFFKFTAREAVIFIKF